MRKKSVKSIIVNKVVTAVMISATIITAIPVFASSGNTSWSGSASTPGSTIRTSSKTKTTDSSVFANYTSGGSEFVGVRIYARTSSGSWDDCTYYTSSYPIYYAYKGENNFVDVLNTAYEENGSCSVQAGFTVSTAGTHSGKWRPDF